MQILHLLSQSKLTKDVAKFMKSLDFGSVGMAGTEEETETISSNNERLENRKKEKSIHEHASNRKAGTKVAEMAMKVAGNTYGDSSKFVRVVLYIATGF